MDPKWDLEVTQTIGHNLYLVSFRVMLKKKGIILGQIVYNFI